MIEQDISEPGLQNMNCDKILNLACLASPKYYQRYPLDTLRTSLVGTSNLLKVARVLEVPFLQASTSEVYGDPQDSPQIETLPGYVDSMSNRACYVEGKRAVETLCMLYQQELNVSTRIARIFNSYGPGMLPNDGRVVSTFICQALAQRPLTVHGHGDQTRSLCYVSDTVRGLLAMIDYSGSLDYPINIGNPEEITIIELAQEISQLINPGCFLDIDYWPLPPHEPMRRCPDICRATSILGWAPNVHRAEGLQRTIEWFRMENPQPLPVDISRLP
jgi:UDP-glucuronate decarboxylase